MPSPAEHETDPEREQVYKRGYAHGVAASISAIIYKLNDIEKQKIDLWFRNELTPWMQDATLLVRPPEFPKL